MKYVTAIVTTYHREPNIIEGALHSILKQTYPVQEILLIDDNEDDSQLSARVQEMCSRYRSVRYIKQDGNQGACAARNLGISQANGEFIGFLDDDDRWLPEKIEKQVKAFEENDDTLGLVFCSGIVVNEQTGEQSAYYNHGLKKDVSFEDLIVRDYVGSTSNPLIRKRCFDEVGGFWTEQPARQDYEMWLRISTKFRLLGLEGQYFIYTLHPGEQITKDDRKSYIGFRNIYKRHKNGYVKNPRARIDMLNVIIRCRDRITPEILLFWLEREWVQIRYGLRRDTDEQF